jgi:hypothetical protein
MTSIGLHQLPHLAFKNKGLVQGSKLAGCYHCGKTFESKEIKDFTDNGQTCLCPSCGIDSIVGDMSGFPITETSMQDAHKYLFG